MMYIHIGRSSSFYGSLFCFAFLGQILIDAFGYMFGILDDLYDIAGAEDDITGREDAFSCGRAVFIDFDKAALVDFQACCRADNLVLRSLTDGDDGAVSGKKLRFIFADEMAFFIEMTLLEHRTFTCDGVDTLIEFKFDSVGLCIFVLADARAYLVATGVNGNVATAFADGCTGGIHG